jgi:hypothetical protein
MTDRKSAIISVLVLILPLCLVGLFHPGYWIFRWDPLPPEAVDAHPHPPPHPVDTSLPPPHFDDFVARYGPPDSEEQSAKGVLNPPLFTKWLDYEPEHLRVAFVAAETPDQIPTRRWVLISFVDSRRTEPISPEEAGRRLLSRQK